VGGDQVSKAEELLRTYLWKQRIRRQQIERRQLRIVGHVAAHTGVERPPEVHTTVARNNQRLPSARACLSDVKGSWSPVSLLRAAGAGAHAEVLRVAQAEHPDARTRRPRRPRLIERVAGDAIAGCRI